MNRLENHDAVRQKKWKAVNTWAIKGPLLLIAVLLGFFEHDLRWGRGSFAAGMAMILPIIGFRGLWNEVRFWITVILLGAIQVPLVIEMNPLIEKFRLPLAIAFTIVDGLLVARAISFVCLENTRNRLF